ncbi:MAG: 7-cyano-7-deazaguanine synthase [Verrucomicrobiales bacterium]|nr:7-cyano-7-deazaguanine synthase [Verrucomicrobiales bacterium]
MSQRLPFSVSYWTGARESAETLRAGTHFHFDLDAVNKFCLFDLPQRLVDLLRIASAIYVVDRLVKRRSQLGRRRRARSLGIKVDVLNIAFWNCQKVRETISEAVDFVSGDDSWDIEFVKDTRVLSRAKQLLPDPNGAQSPLIALYSGGLDSAAGLACRIAENTSRPVVAVTAWHQSRQRPLVRKQLDLLRRRFGAQIDSLMIKVQIDWNSGMDRKQQERSQRCRSFLFASLGAVAAIMHGEQTIEMLESGVGAINLPLMAGSIGSRTTRSSHPEFLRLMSRLANLAGDREIEFRLPFYEQTKGQVVKHLVDLNLQKLASMTASCVGFPLRDSHAKQCGICPACLFRRQAMKVAGIPEPDHAYKYDIFNPSSSDLIPVERLKYLKAFLMQVAQLDGVEMNDRLSSAFERHVLSTRILQRGQSQKGVIDLLARYRDEWIAIASHAQRNGHAWAKWLAPQRPQERQEQGVTYASA